MTVRTGSPVAALLRPSAPTAVHRYALTMPNGATCALKHSAPPASDSTRVSIRNQPSEISALYRSEGAPRSH